MKTEEVKKIIEENLKKMGSEDITFLETKDNSLIVAFNCKEITSFVANIEGWTYTGIQLDSTTRHQYKIDFKKLP